MFIVLISPAIPDHLRGYLSRFLMEPRPNIFVGNCSSTVATRLWDRAIDACGAGSLTLIQSSPSAEQGFEMRFHGDRSPLPYDLDGLTLLSRLQVAEKGESTQ